MRLPRNITIKVESERREMIREELIEALTLLKEHANSASGTNTFVWDINIDSFNFVIDSTIKALKQEPTTKNDLGVDLISRADLYNRIKTIDHDEDYECDEYGGNRITYHTCDWDEVLREIEDAPSVTPQEPRWIPVEKRLPDTDDEVLCWYEYYHWSREKVLPEYGLGSYLKETSSWFGEVANGHKVRVIAWMPLPKAYREVEE